MKKANVSIILSTILMVIAVIFVGIGFIFSKVINKKIENEVKTVGIIENITSNYDGEDYDYVVYVRFTDESGNTNIVKSNYYSSSMREGNEIDVYYNAKNPSDYKVGNLSDFKIIFYILYGVGGFFLLLSTIILVFSIKSKNNRKRVIQAGIIVYGKITSVTRNTLITINGRSPYVIIVNFMYNDLTYEVRSENMWNDPQFVIDNYGINELPVYIDTNNPKKSVLDAKMITEKFGK